MAGTKYRGEFEEKLQAIVEEVTDEKAPPTILFIDGECFIYTGHAVWDNPLAGGATHIDECYSHNSREWRMAIAYFKNVDRGSWQHCSLVIRSRDQKEISTP